MKTKKEILDETFITEYNADFEDILDAECDLGTDIQRIELIVSTAMEAYATQQTADLTTQLAKANSDKEKLVELLKENRRTFLMIGDDYTDNKQHDRAEVWYDEVRKADELLTDCGITL
jgi:uncharacterized HAD superfamily protein